MSKLEIKVKSIEELANATKQILQFAGNKEVIAFSGELGSGKTTLIRELFKRLSSQDNFSSPTYSIVNKYSVPSFTVDHSLLPISKIYHMDFYRIKNIQEASDAGVEEYINIDSDNFCF